MANGMTDFPSQRLLVQQFLHGYSDGHRLLSSSCPLKGRDAKTMLVMSDASGPAATIPEGGYLTGYPLPDAGYYAIARTWPAPEMARPGCVWTHTMIIDFSDIPTLQSVASIAALFRRPSSGSELNTYDQPLLVSRAPAVPDSKLDQDFIQRLLWALYAHPARPVIASRGSPMDREMAVLALWDQQWPRLRRAFRFCTLSFADRSSTSSPFDLQFLPPGDRSPRSRFPEAIDADREAPEDTVWLRLALTDIKANTANSLRQFLKSAGGDVSGREAFAPLSEIYHLARQFSADPGSVDQAIAVMEMRVPGKQALVARALIVATAADSPDLISDRAIDFVIQHWDLIDHDFVARSERLGMVIWSRDPLKIGKLLSDNTARKEIAEASVRKLLPDQLISGIRKAPPLMEAVVIRRPDLFVQSDFWSIDGAWTNGVLSAAAHISEQVPATLSAMLDGNRNDAVVLVRDHFGSEQMLRAVTSALDSRLGGPISDPERRWLSVSVSDMEAIARILSEGSIQYRGTLSAISNAVSPDSVPNDFGEDPWITATRAAKQDEIPSIHLSGFLLARGLGRRSKSAADLIRVGFDEVYRRAAHASLPNETMQALDGRLPTSFFWFSWDVCQRLRSAVVDAFVDQGLPPSRFWRITADDGVFALLVELAARTYSGRHFLSRVKSELQATDDEMARRRLIIIKDARA